MERKQHGILAIYCGKRVVFVPAETVECGSEIHYLNEIRRP